MAAVTKGKPRFISVRVEILSPGALKDKTIEPLNAFRLRLDEDSTFADLANAALLRYSKEHPECSRKPVAGGIFDEKNCAVDLDDGVDIIQQGEVLKLVLAPSGSSNITSTTSHNDVTTTPSRPSQTPAVKKIRPILPGLSQALAHRSSFPPRSSGLGSSQPRSSPLDNVLPRSGQSQYVAIKTSRRPVSKSKGGKQDPYELPSDTDDDRVHNGKKPKSQTANARNRLVKSEPGHNSNPPETIDLTIPTKTRSISREANFIVIEDSSSRSTSPELSDFPRAVSLSGGPAQVRVENPSFALHVTSNKSRKRSVSHSINDHIKFIGANRDNVEETGDAQYIPPYMVENSQGIVPVFTRKEVPGQRSTARRPSASSIPNSKSSKRAKSVGPLTLTPSRIAAATKSLHERFQQEAKARQAAKQAAALQAAQVEEEKKRAKAEARRNTPSAAIAHIKSMTETKFGRKAPRKRIPDAFFHDHKYSDNEELDDDIQKATSYKPATNDAEDEKTISNPRTSRSTRPLSSAVTQSISFQPINRLWPEQEPKDQTKLQKKLAPAYSKRAHDAFADLDQSDAESTKESQLNSAIIEATDEVTDEDAPSTPDPFRRWFTEYETHFVPHLGFCSVADGPFEGLIRSGPRKGQYLSGHISPSAAKIAEMEKVAVPRERLSNVWSSDPEVVEYNDNISDSDDEVFPSSRPQSTKSTVSSESESTSILIMRQLSQEEPPSNQELGILMSSSPSRSTIDSAHTPDCHRSLQLAANHTAESPGIAATTPKLQAETHRRDSDLDITPNFERALSQVETPSTRSRSTQKTPAESSASLDNVQPAKFGRIVVKVPQLSPEKQAEYKKVPDNRNRHRRSPLKSFMEINRVHEDTQIASQDSGAAAIEHVLNASPSWLTNITEIEPRTSEHDRRTPYRLRSHAVTTPCHTMIGLQPRPEFKVDLTKHQDPTFQPSDSHSASETSADEQKERFKILAKERASNTPENPVRALLFTRGAVSQPSQGPDTTSKRDASINDPEWIRSTPIPAPSIPELLQRIKDTPLMECLESQTPALEEPESVITTQLERGSLESTMKRSTTPHPAVADFTHGAYSQTPEHHNKRKHEDDIHALAPEQAHNSSPRKKRKKHGCGESTDKSRQRAKQDKGIRAKKKKDTSRNQSMVLKKTLPPHRGGPNEVCTAKTPDEPVATMLSQPFDQSLVSQAHMGSPEIPDVIETQAGSATHDLSKASGLSDTLGESRGSRKKKRDKNRKQKRMGQPNGPASRAQSNSFHHRNAQMPKLTMQHSAEVKSGKERGSKKTQTTKASIPRSADKLPSPPITSRPSSAGSAF